MDSTAIDITPFSCSQENKNSKIFIPFPEPQIHALFLSRPQRFLAEVLLADGTSTIAYCPNSGSFEGCLDVGSQVLLWKSPPNSKRKRVYTLRAIKHKCCWIGLDTSFSNRIAEKMLSEKLIPSLKSLTSFEKEPCVGKGTKLDFSFMTKKQKGYIEVKSATVAFNGSARYPDSFTVRGIKQLKILTTMAQKGYKAILLFIVQRDDVSSFAINRTHPSPFFEAYLNAINAGVKIFAFSTSISQEGIGIPYRLKVSQK